MSYFDIYKKRVNRWGENYQDRLFNMRAQNFENQLKKSVYLVEFPYQDKDEQGEFVRYKQDETETLHYLLTRHNVFLEPGSIYHFLNARKEEVPWMVHYFEEQPARGYNKYIMLKMSHLVKWEDSKGDARETYAYFFSNVNTALSDAIKTSSEASIFFENDNLISQLLKQGVSSQIISGPPYKNVEAFDWEKFEFKDAPHWCMPQIWKFPWLQIDKTATFSVIGYE